MKSHQTGKEKINKKRSRKKKTRKPEGMSHGEEQSSALNQVQFL